MKIRLLQPMAGPDGCHREGSIVEMADESAHHLIQTGQATDVEGKVVISKPEPVKSPVVETATKPLGAAKTADSAKGKAHANQKDKPSDSPDSTSGDKGTGEGAPKDSSNNNG